MIGVHTGGPHGLDHIGVLCAGLQIPLVVSEEKTLAAAREFYPDLQVVYRDLPDLSLEFFARRASALLTCSYRFAEEFAPLSDTRIIYCPHGNSDKNLGAARQDLSLIYGEHMKDLLRSHNCRYPTVTSGNYRALYYEMHKAALSAKLDEHINENFCSTKKTVFYAPTYDLKTFPDAFRVIQELSPHFNLLLRWHPLLDELYPAEVEKLKHVCEEVAHICDLSAFPAIYPILHRADFYLGDASSIGYDFLTLNKPLFFLGKYAGEIYACGTPLASHDTWDLTISTFQDTTELKMARRKLATRTFGKTKPFKEMMQEIQQALQQSRACRT